MKVLDSELYEREGNDSWLIDKVQIISEDGELILRHKRDWKGWAEPIKETNEKTLTTDEGHEACQKDVDDYLKNSMLYEMEDRFNMKEILESWLS